MASWIPHLLPYVVEAAKIAIPAFTEKRATKKQPTEDLVATQISELQEAVTHNAQTLQNVARQLQETLEHLNDESAKMQADLQRYKTITRLALLGALLGVSLGLYAAVF